MQLPGTLHDQAGEIARAIAVDLIDVSSPFDLNVDRLTLPRIEVASGAGVKDVAQHIAQSIRTALSRQRR